MIPTFGRGQKLKQCLRCLAAQRVWGAGLAGEVVVGIDGASRDGLDASEARRAWAEAGGKAGALVVLELDRVGSIAARRAILEAARGTVLIGLNDDVQPREDFIEQHAHEQLDRLRAGRQAILVGHSPYIVRNGDTLVNRLARETSMIFFYSAMTHGTHSTEHDFGYRYCYGLNFSVLTEAVRKVGGFAPVNAAYGYDDIELAYRLQDRMGVPVLSRPKAIAEHDHWYEPEDVLAREESLGQSAWDFAHPRACPEFCVELFGRDIRSAEELEYSRAFVQREQAAADMQRETFLQLGRLPADVIGPEQSKTVLEALRQQHFLLKRWLWRRGLLKAAGAL